VSDSASDKRQECGTNETASKDQYVDNSYLSPPTGKG
jgi:hypothetical protein